MTRLLLTPHRTSPAGATRPDTPATRTAAALGSVLLVGAVLSPIRRLWQQKPQDDFPLSHYPMFSTDRKNRTWLYHLRGYDAAGEWQPLSYKYLGYGGLNQVRRVTRVRARAGEGEKIATRAARNVARRGWTEDAGVIGVDLVKAKYLLDQYMAGEREPASLKVLGSAPVPGRGNEPALSTGELEPTDTLPNDIVDPGPATDTQPLDVVALFETEREVTI